MLNTPISLIIFDRSDTTSPVIGAICRVRPKRPFVAADGPRDGVASDRGSWAAASHRRRLAGLLRDRTTTPLWEYEYIC